MTPWPTADVQCAQPGVSPTTSPMQQPANQDPFAAYGPPAPAAQAPQQPVLQQQVAQQPVQQPVQQPIAQQPAANVDPWAAYGAPPAQAPAPTQAPMQAPPVAPSMQPAPMPMQAPVQPQMQAPPAPMQAPAPVQPQELTPPPAVVQVDTANQQPPSPMGDVSVLAAAAAPPMPTATQGVMPLQPAPQPVAQTVQPPAPVMQAPALVAQMPAQAPPAPVQVQPAQVPPQPAPANPFDFAAVPQAPPPAAMPAPPPAAMPPQAPPTPPTETVPMQNGVAPVQPPMQPATMPAAVPAAQPTAQPTAQPFGMPSQAQLASPPMSPVQPGTIAPQQQAFADPFGYAFSPMTSPVTSPNGSPGNGAMVPSSSPSADPFGVFGGQVPPAGVAAPPMMPSVQAPAPVAQPPVAQAMVPSQAPSADPFGVFGAGQAPAPATADPFGGGALATSAPPAAAADPFGGAFGGAPAAAPAQAPAPVQQEADLWAGFNESAGFQPSEPAANTDPRLEVNQTAAAVPEGPITLDSNNLPSQGDYYEARINARSLGAMFYTARNVEETLYAKVPKNVVEALASRPVVAYVAENSAAFNSGVTLGHVIVSVNGEEVTDPERCAQVIRNAPRPMNLRCYVPPNLTLTLSEGRHLVKYDTKDLEAPGSSMEWKRKYVVVGGIVTKPWMINMFYRKKDYDVAVKEAHAGHKISVKVKQFDLRGARIILKGKDGNPNWVDYPSERKPWYYITILPNKGYPIKISSESLEELEPVYAAVRRFVRKDMDARYQYQVAGMGPGMVPGSSERSNGSPGNGSSNGFEGFGDKPEYQSATAHWNR